MKALSSTIHLRAVPREERGRTSRSSPLLVLMLIAVTSTFAYICNVFYWAYEEVLEKESGMEQAFIAGVEQPSPSSSKPPAVQTLLEKSPNVLWPPRDAVDRIADQYNRVIVLLLNCGGLDFADNLIASMSRFGVNNFVLVPLDDFSYELFQVVYPDNVVPPKPDELQPFDAEYSSFRTKGFHDATQSRPSILLAFAEAGYTILYSDVDMVWNGNVLDALDRGKFSSNSNEHTFETILYADNSRISRAKQKVKHCSGMFFMQPTSNNIAFLRAWKNKMKDSLPNYIDQTGFNEVLREMSTKFSYRVFDGNDFFPSGAEYFDEWDDEKRSRAILVHNNYITGRGKKLTRFIQFNLWSPSGRLDRITYNCAKRKMDLT